MCEVVVIVWVRSDRIFPAKTPPPRFARRQMLWKVITEDVFLNCLIFFYIHIFTHICRSWELRLKLIIQLEFRVAENVAFQSHSNNQSLFDEFELLSLHIQKLLFSKQYIDCNVAFCRWSRKLKRRDGSTCGTSTWAMFLPAHLTLELE